jgi:nifR3 family TIM-barrel protein
MSVLPAIEARPEPQHCHEPLPPAPRPATLVLRGVTMPSRFSLAPLAGYTSLALRLALRELGGLGLATTDLVSSRALQLSSPRTLELIQTCPEDRPFAVQIYGSEAADLCIGARMMEAHGATVVDINMGCPVHKVCRGGGGSAMMCDPVRTIDLVRSVVESVQVPVTVKMRLGWDDENLTSPYFAREFEKVGIAAITIHGRTRAQGFSGKVNLEGIRRTVEAVERVPIIGNGDVLSIRDAARMLDLTGCAGIAIGRGALLNPWFFSQLTAWETGQPLPAPTRGQRVDFMDRHLHLLAQYRGDRHGCIMFRKVANWYCRAIKPGKDIQQRLMMLASVAEFETIVSEVRDRLDLTCRDSGPDLTVPVPKGPNERW